MSKAVKQWNKIKVKSITVKSFSDSSKKQKENSETDKFSFKNWVIKTLKEFCSVTALHGYGHIVREDTHYWERIAWAITAFAAAIVAAVLLYFSWMWNAETPTVTVIESTHYATWNIPFPAVTICNSNKISASAALAKATSMTRPANMSAEQLSLMFRLALHFEGVGEGTDSNYNDLHDIFKANNINVDTLLKDLTPKCADDMLERCMWKGTQTRCDTLFQMIKTTVGYCCSFNYYGLAKDNFPPKLTHSIPKLPRRVTACGYETGLSVLIKPNIADYHSTVLSTYGFRVLIHDPYDYGDDNAETKLVTSKLEAFISISPEATYSTRDVYDLPLKERNCLHEDERKMNVVQKYSYVNCLAECRANIVFQACGCIPYNLPNNGSRPVCEMNQLICVKKNREWFQGSLPGINKTVASLTEIEYSPCGCYPDCELSQYPTDISSSDLNRNFSFNSLGFFKDIKLVDESLLHVFFKDLISTHYRNDMYQNWLGVLASFGGLLGLFLGFSLVTGFELIYFFTLRILFDKIAPKKVLHEY